MLDSLIINYIFEIIKNKWKSFILIGFLFSIIGFSYAWLHPVSYKATITFVVEEGKSGGSLSSLASIAGQLGVDVGSASNGSLISGDNILYYFQSKKLSRDVLLSRMSQDSFKSVADYYAEIYELDKQWSSNKRIGPIKFQPFDTFKPYSRIQDSLLNFMVEKILMTQFNVFKIDKKAGFIEVSSTMKDELLAKIYCEKLVELAVKEYLNIKTKRQQLTVKNLQLRVDSIANLLALKTFSSANLQTINSTMDINPLYKVNSNVNLETYTRDKTMLATIFASVTQNLELAKFTLSQETPVIQIVDHPILPLFKIKKSRLQYAILFAFISNFLLFIFYIYKKQKNLNGI